MYGDIRLAMVAVLFLALAVIIWLYVYPDISRK